MEMQNTKIKDANTALQLMKHYLLISKAYGCDSCIYALSKDKILVLNKTRKYYITIDDFKKDFNIDLVLSMACSLTLDPVDYHMVEDFSEVYSTKDNEDWYKIEKNTIDLFEMVWSNVIMNLPIRVVREDAYEILASRGITLEQDIQE